MTKIFKILAAGAIILLSITSCMTTQETTQRTNNGVDFKLENRDSAIMAIVNTLQEEGVDIETINEKFGMVKVKDDIPAATVSKWRGDSAFLMGTTKWGVEMSFTVKETGEVNFKYCQASEGDSLLTGGDCVPYKSLAAQNYLISKIKSYES